MNYDELISDQTKKPRASMASSGRLRLPEDLVEGEVRKLRR